MKVLWFSNTPVNAVTYKTDGQTIGGGWLQALDKAINTEVDLHIAFLNPHGEDTFNHQGTTYHSIKPKGWKQRLIRKWFTGKSLSRNKDITFYMDIIRKVKPDVIHIHGTENDFIRLIPHVKQHVIVSIQGNLTMVSHKYWGVGYSYWQKRTFTSKAVTKAGFLPQTLLDQYKDLKRRARSERKWMSSIKHVAGRTDWDYRITRILSPNSTYYHIGEILREEFYKHQWKPGSNKEEIVIHTTTGGAPYKGFETICHSAILLDQMGVEFTWKVAGLDESSPVVRLAKRKWKKKYPAHRIKLLGKVPATLLIQEMLGSGLYVMPSHIENSPNSLCEAMLLGMPCVAAFAGGTGSLIQDGASGVLIQDGDPYVMAGAIRDLMIDTQKAKQMGRQARNMALLRHNKESIVDQLFETYRQILMAG